MTTIAPHLVEAILHTRTILAAAVTAPASQSQSHAAAGFLGAIMVAVFIFMSAIARVTSRIAGLLSALVQTAAAVTSALFAIAVAIGIIAVLLLHG